MWVARIAGLLVLALAGAALAQDIPWQTVSLGGGFTIDVPAVAANRYKPDAAAPKDILMIFTVDAGDPGSMSCQLRRRPYSNALPRQTLVDGLAKGNTGAFCQVASPTIKDWQLGSASAASSDGIPAGICLSAYTDTSQKQAGKVMTMKVVAGAKNIYQLLCLSQFDDKDGAVTAYATRWGAIVDHLQQSLHLPKEEK